MIVSHEHRFIFVKTRKTAGTSIEVALSGLAGADAIVTPVQPPEPGHEPRHWRRLFNPVPELRERYLRHEPSLATRSVSSTLGDLRRRRAFRNHLPASLVRARLGRSTWDRYYTFCFERNPWEKVVSWFFYTTRNEPEPQPFERWALRADLPSDWDRYTLEGRVAVDFVGRFEALDEDLRRALSHVGVGTVPQLPRAKASIRDTRADTPMSDAVDERIRRVFAREIEAFGYARPASLG